MNFTFYLLNLFACKSNFEIVHKTTQSHYHPTRFIAIIKVSDTIPSDKMVVLHIFLCNVMLLHVGFV